MRSLGKGQQFGSIANSFEGADRLELRDRPFLLG